MFGQRGGMIKKNMTGTMRCTEANLVEEGANREKFYKLTESNQINVWFIGKKTVECV